MSVTRRVVSMCHLTKLEGLLKEIILVLSPTTVINGIISCFWLLIIKLNH